MINTATIRVKATVTTPVGMDERTWLDNVGHKKLVANPPIEDSDGQKK
jgi:hypothetical protein